MIKWENYGKGSSKTVKKNEYWKNEFNKLWNPENLHPQR